MNTFSKMLMIKIHNKEDDYSMKGGNQYRQNFFDDFMFGKRRSGHSAERHHFHGQIKEIEHLLNKFDLDELMENIDYVVDTAMHLKPYVNKISLYLKQFLKK
jgi:hypothetical protein